MERFLSRTTDNKVQTLRTPLQQSTGAADAGRIVATGSDGKLDSSLIPGSASGGSFEMGFTQVNLSIANVLPVTHDLGSYPSAIAVFDENGQVVWPDGWENVSVNAIGVDLSSFVPLDGTWKISVVA